MAILEVKDMIRPVTRDEFLDDETVLAQAVGFKGSSARIGSRDRFWIMSLAEVASRCSVQIAQIAASGFNETARGRALSKFSKSRYDNPRVVAIKTQGQAVLTDSGNNGPHNIAVGERVFTSEEDSTLTYRNITGGTIPLGGSLEVTIEAETGGAKYNVATDTITSMAPVIAGVDVTNPADPTDWITRVGVDEESDVPLQQSNTEKWSTLSGNSPAGAYEYWARTAVDEFSDPVGVTRTSTDATNPGGPYTAYIYCADESGTITTEQRDDVQAYINGKLHPTARVTVFAATEHAINIAGSFYVRQGQAAEASTAIQEAITAYIDGLNLGGTLLSGGAGSGVVVFAELITVAMAAGRKFGVVNFIPTSPTADVALSPGEVAVVGTYAVTAIEV